MLRNKGAWICVYETVRTQNKFVLACLQYVSMCAHAVVSLPVCVHGCMRVCGCIDPFLAAVV